MWEISLATPTKNISASRKARHFKVKKKNQSTLKNLQNECNQVTVALLDCNDFIISGLARTRLPLIKYNPKF